MNMFKLNYYSEWWAAWPLSIFYALISPDKQNIVWLCKGSNSVWGFETCKVSSRRKSFKTYRILQHYLELAQTKYLIADIFLTLNNVILAGSITRAVYICLLEVYYPISSRNCTSIKYCFDTLVRNILYANPLHSGLHWQAE